MDKVLDFLHSHFLLLTESLQESCCKLFEKIWTSEMDFRETYVPNMCTYLMTMAVRQGRSFSAYMNRLYVFSPSPLSPRNAIRASFKLIDFTNRASDTLKALILHAVAMESFITHTHGKKLLSM